MYEITFYSRGGQGAKSAVMFLGEIFSKLGKYVQAFPEYGPERQGAPIRAYARISDKEIKVNSQIEKPNLMIFLDVSLFEESKIESLKSGGVLILNTSKNIEIKRKDIKVYHLDATKISLDLLKRNVPNVPIMAFFPFLMEEISFEEFKAEIKILLEGKFRDEIVELNLKALDRAHKEIGDLYE